MRLHLAKINQLQDFDAQARELAAKLSPASSPVSVTSAEEAWPLAQWVDLVDAGYGEKNAVYCAARKSLERFVVEGWQQPESRRLFGRSAALMAFVNEQLDRQEAEFDLDVREALRELAA